MKAIETITIRTVAKGSNLSRKAILKAIEELGVEAYYMRMKAYGARGHVGQIKLEDAEKVIAKATEYKEEPKQPKVSKLDQLKANGFEILSETKTQYRLSKDGVTRSVGKSKSIEKILKRFETKQEEVKEEVKKEPASVKQYEEFVPQIKKAIEKEFPNTEVKNVIVMDKVDDTHYWVKWDGISYSESLGDMLTEMPLMEVTIEE